MIDAGYAAACEALDGVGETLYASGGVFPRRHVELSVNRDRCTGCGMCATLAPDVMRMEPDGKAAAAAGVLEWSRADGAFVTECPVKAIGVEVVEANGDRHRTMEFPVDGE
jgi:ferredoxin